MARIRVIPSLRAVFGRDRLGKHRDGRQMGVVAGSKTLAHSDVDGLDEAANVADAEMLPHQRLLRPVRDGPQVAAFGVLHVA